VIDIIYYLLLQSQTIEKKHLYNSWNHLLGWNDDLQLIYTWHKQLFALLN